MFYINVQDVKIQNMSPGKILMMKYKKFNKKNRVGIVLKLLKYSCILFKYSYCSLYFLTDLTNQSSESFNKKIKTNIKVKC